VNRHKDQPIDVEFELQDRTSAGPPEVSEVNGPDIKAENDFRQDDGEDRHQEHHGDGKKLRVSLPAHSYALVGAPFDNAYRSELHAFGSRLHEFGS
jgi:alpha-N-arabinofuranosidase